MECSKARLLLLDRDAGRAPGADQEELGEHLAQCEECREAFSEAQVLGAVLRQWPDEPTDADDRRRVAKAMAAAHAEMTKSVPLWRRVPLAALRFRLLPATAAVLVCAVLVVMWPSAPSEDLVAAVGEALEGVDVWSANGTITPALISLGDRPTNKVEIWFRKPDTIRVSLDDDTIAMLQEGTQRTWYIEPLGWAFRESTQATDLVRLFSVQDWLADESVLDSPVSDLGETWFLPQRVRTLEIDVAEAHAESARDLGIDALVLEANVDSMLPVHIRADGFRELRDRLESLIRFAGGGEEPKPGVIRNPAADYLTLHLFFKYGSDIDEDAFELQLPEGVTANERQD